MKYKFILIISVIAQFFAQGDTIKKSSELIHMRNGIAAVVEGEIITFENLRKDIKPLLNKLRLEANNEKEFAVLINKLTKELLEEAINKVVIIKEAEDKGIIIPPSYIDDEYERIISRDFEGKRSNFLNFLKLTGKTQSEFRKELKDDIIVSAMRSNELNLSAEISPKKIEEFYYNNKIKFYQPEFIHLKQIILSPKTNETIEDLKLTAEEIYKKIQLGSQINELANEYAKGPYNKTNGDWGWVKKDDLRVELANYAFNLKKGEFSEPIVIDENIFILYIEDIQEEQIQSINNVRDIIENILKQKSTRNLLDNWLTKLRKNAYIKYYL